MGGSGLELGSIDVSQGHAALGVLLHLKLGNGQAAKLANAENLTVDKYILPRHESSNLIAVARVIDQIHNGTLKQRAKKKRTLKQCK